MNRDMLVSGLIFFVEKLYNQYFNNLLDLLPEASHSRKQVPARNVSSANLPLQPPSKA